MSTPAGCCQTCLWWVRGASPIATQTGLNPLHHTERGACHFNPPRPTYVAPGRVESLIPETSADFVCGRWKASEARDPVVVPIQRGVA